MRSRDSTQPRKASRRKRFCDSGADKARARQDPVKASGTSREWILEQLKENVEKAMQPRPVLLRGRPTGEYCYDGNAANRALEAAGKALGLFRTAPEDPLRLARQRYERMTPEERFSEDRLLLAQALLVIEEYYYAEGK